MNNNKGFTLIELLVAIAISGIVLLMLSFILVQGTKMFNNENDNINISNDYQVVRNQIDEAIMEAKTLIVVYAGEDVVVYTGDVNTANNKLAAEGDDSVTTERIITYDKSEGRLYISNSYEDAVSEGNLLSDMVTSFDVTVSEDCIRETEISDGGTDRYYVNPLNVNVDLDLKSEKDGDISVKVRNILSSVTTYRTDSRETLLTNATNVLQVKVK